MNAVLTLGDQADTLRRLACRPVLPQKVVHPRSADEEVRQARVMAFTSGKGGVGKSTIVVNLAIALARRGKKVLLIDADLGLANIDVLLGLKPVFNLNHLFSGEKSLADIVVEGPAGIRFVPAGSGVQKYTSLGQRERIVLLDALDCCQEDFDFLLIDTGAGISENVTYFNAAAQEIVVVLSPEPTSITDAYALIKVLVTGHAERHFRILVNQTTDHGEGERVYRKLAQVTDRFLNVSLDYLGQIMRDDRVLESIRQQTPITCLYPDSAVSRRFFDLAGNLAMNPVASHLKGTIQFCSRRNFSYAGGME